MSPADAELMIAMITEAPCVAAIKLKAIKLSMATTGTVQKIEFRDRSTWFQPAADSSILDELIRQADEACAAASGKVSHFAVTLGGGRRRGPQRIF